MSCPLATVQPPATDSTPVCCPPSRAARGTRIQNIIAGGILSGLPFRRIFTPAEDGAYAVGFNIMTGHIAAGDNGDISPWRQWPKRHHFRITADDRWQFPWGQVTRHISPAVIATLPPASVLMPPTP